jgi:hypothetical protein
MSIAGVTYPVAAFQVTNHYPDSLYPICTILLVPEAPATSADTCRAIAAIANPDWNRYADPNGRVIWGQNASELQCIWPGSTGSGFRVVLTRAHSCCYKAEFFGALEDPFAVDEICFNCDLPTDARASTWGQIKAVYR